MSSGGVAWGSYLDIQLLPDYIVYCGVETLGWGVVKRVESLEIFTRNHMVSSKGSLYYDGLFAYYCRATKPI